MSYSKSAPYYDAIYGYKKYDEEARRVWELILANAEIPVTNLLDVACGTGRHDEFLAQWCEVEGLDNDAEQLKVAASRLPGMKFYRRSMVDFRLPKRYQAITCLFSAIGHITKLADMQLTIKTMADHLDPGGVLLIEPWLLPGMWMDNHLSTVFIDEPNLKLSRVTRGERQGNLIILEMAHSVEIPGQKLDQFMEHHEVMMYTEAEFLEAFAAAGLKGAYDPAGINDNGRGIFIATKPL